jgi:hypothetical protein
LTRTHDISKQGAEFQLIFPFVGGQKAGFGHSNGRGANRHYLPGQIWHITIVKQEYFWFAYQREYGSISS